MWSKQHNDMAYHMEFELSGINAHDVDNREGAYGPLPEHLVYMVLSYNGEHHTFQ